MKKRSSKRFAKIQKSRFSRSIFNFLLWQLGYYKDPQVKMPVPADFYYPNVKAPPDLDKPSVTWINHSTFLIQYQNVHILTDPIWNMRCSPFNHFGPARRILPPMTLEALPKIDLVLISHNHYDHLDRYSVTILNRLFPDIFWVVPEGVKRWFKKRFKEIRDEQITELTWGESSALQLNQCSLKVTSVPAQHFSGRGIFDQNKTLWMGIVVTIEKNKDIKKLYFAGDTGYHPEYFKEIGEKQGPMDLSLIPIGVYSPREFMQPVHVNPEESVKIHKEVGSKLSVGCHFGTFKLSYEDLRQPPFDLFHILQEEQLDVEKFRVLEPGQTINW